MFFIGTMLGSGEVLDTYLLFTSNGVSCVDAGYKMSRGRPTTNQSLLLSCLNKLHIGRSFHSSSGI